MPARMTAAEIDAFLDEPHVAVLVTINKDGTPNPQPVWYVHRDGVFHISTEDSSVKGRNIARDPRVSICVQQETLPYKSVTVWGTASTGPHDKALSREIAVRYLGKRGADAYLGDGEGSADSIVVSLKPERTFSQDYTRDTGAAG